MSDPIDFDGLLKASEATIADINASDIPYLQQSLPELQTYYHGQPAAAVDEGAHPAAVSRLLAQKFDTDQLNVIRHMELDAKYDPMSELPETDIDSYLAHHHDVILSTAVEEAKHAAEEETLRLQRVRELDQWRQERRELLESLHLGLYDAVPLAAPAHGQGSNQVQPPLTPGHLDGPGATPANASVIPMDMSASVSIAVSGAGGLSAGTAAGANAGEALPTAAHSTMGAAMKEYAAVVRRMNDELRFRQGGATLAEPFQPIVHFKDLAQRAVPPSPHAPGLASAKAYVSCFDLIKCMVDYAGRGAGAGTGNALPTGHQVNGAGCEFQERQYRDWVEEQIPDLKRRDATSLGEPTLIKDVHGVVQVLPGRGAGDGQPYAHLYYFLRCGGLRSTLASMAGQGSQVEADLERFAAPWKGYWERPVDRGVIDTLKALARFLASAASTMGDATVDGTYQSLAKHVTAMRNASRTAQQHGKQDVYELAVLNLVSFTKPQQHLPPDPFMNGHTVEDWLWQLLWFCQPTAAAGVVSEPFSFGLENLKELIVKHKNKLYNPENPFRYAQTLMLAQDFSGAMKLLWERDCAVEAVHAALSLRFHGVAFAAPASGVGDDKLWDWVHRYARQFQNTDPGVALEYLMQLRESVSEANLMDSLVRLLLDTKAYPMLAGQIGQDGMRQRGQALLDRHLSHDKVSSLLEEAAQEATRTGLVADAIDLYRLAGNFEQAIRQLNRRLSQLLTEDHPERETWRRVALNFKDQYMDDTGLNQTLKAKVLDSVKEDFKLLLGLYHFFDMVQGGAPQQPSAVNDLLPGLMILPTSASDADMASALSRLDAMMSRADAVLRGEHLRHLLLQAMRCRLALHNQYRNNGAGMVSPGLGAGYHPEADFNAEQARLLVIFANMVKPNYLPGDTLIQLNRMEVMVV